MSNSRFVRQEAIYDLVHGRKKTGEMQKNLENTGRKPLTRVNVWDIILSLTLVKVKNGYKPSNYAGCSHSPFRNDLCYFFVSSVLVLFIMLRIVDFEINS